MFRGDHLRIEIKKGGLKQKTQRAAYGQELWKALPILD